MRAEVRPLTATERKAFRARSRHRHEALWLLMLLTGLGPGEALGLGWEHLDLEAGTLRVARTLDPRRAARAGHEAPEPQARRPLMPELRAMLRERWIRRAGRRRPRVRQLGAPARLPQSPGADFAPAVERAKIERRVTTYTCGTRSARGARAGVDPLAVARLMGHSSTRWCSRSTDTSPTEEARGR